MYVYSLTDLVGRRKNADRTTVVATVEVNRHTFIVVLLSVAASLLPTVLVGLIAAQFAAVALVVPFLFIVAGLIFVDTKVTKGLQIRRYEAMWDKRKSKQLKGTVFICSEPVHPAQLVLIAQTVIPNPKYSPDLEDSFDPGALPSKVSAPVIGRATATTGDSRPDRSFLE